MSMYYNGGELLSKNRLLNFIIGNRGGGKTYHWKVRSIKEFLKNGKEFIWVRRYNTELENITKWFDDIAHEFEGHKLEVTKKHIKVDGKICGYIGALSTSQRLKSNAYPNVDKIIFDEFLIDKGSLRYIKGEAELMLELIETIFRMRDKGNKVIFIGNAISVVNPYFTYFQIKPNLEQRFTLNEDIAIELYTNEEYIKEKKKTRFGRLIDKTKYGEYAIDNKFLRDNDSFIIERPKKLSYAVTLVYENIEYGVWNNFENGSIYVDRIIEKNSENRIAVTTDDLTESCKLRKWQNYSFYLTTVKELFYESKVYYSDMETKHKIFEVVKLV